MRDQPPSVPQASRDDTVRPATPGPPAGVDDGTGVTGERTPASVAGDDGSVGGEGGTVGIEGQDGAVASAGPDAVEGRPREGHASGAALLKETVIILASALVLSLVIKTFFFQAFFIPSASMRDTLVEGDRVLVTKLVPGPFDVSRGDVVVFKDPGGWLPPVLAADPSALRDRVTSVLTYVGLLPQDSGEHLIKRVIGLPGDRVASDGEGGPITVNGIEITEPYLDPASVPSEVAFDVIVPEGSVWVMGDNRQNSQDSRYHLGDPGGGSVPVDNLVGVAFVTVWPLDRFTPLRNPGSTFEAVPHSP